MSVILELGRDEASEVLRLLRAYHAAKAELEIARDMERAAHQGQTITQGAREWHSPKLKRFSRSAAT